MKAVKLKHRFLAASTLVLGAMLFIVPLHTRMASGAGAVAMQVDRIVKLAIMEYNSAMRAGDPSRWTKYFTDDVKRNAPQASQDGLTAFSDYYAWEFENFEATWTTKRMLISGPVGAVEFEWNAVHKASGTPVKLDMVAVIELAASGKFQSVNFYQGTARHAEYFSDAPGATKAAE
ncbi:MAG: nuclear transport factor 2 family protein [Betaproteobacteria bacterium]|jgi:hypothetical protein|nr:MAG: nuclear transport factor 2 family protein [Betaproteobacteria bacterium]